LAISRICSVNKSTPEKLSGYPGISGFAARAGQPVAKALENVAAVSASVIFSKDIFHAAKVNSTTARGAHNLKGSYDCKYFLAIGKAA